MTGTRVRRRIGMGQGEEPAPVPVIGMGINLPKEGEAGEAGLPLAPPADGPAFKRGDLVDYWDDQLDGLVPLAAVVLRPSPGNPGRYAVNVHLNGGLLFRPDARSATGPAKFCITAPE